MWIGIDARYLSHGLLGGVHTCVSQFVPALLDLAAEHEVFLYADAKRPFELRDLPGHARVRSRRQLLLQAHRCRDPRRLRAGLPRRGEPREWLEVEATEVWRSGTR